MFQHLENYDRYHTTGWEKSPDGTYEFCGFKIPGNAKHVYVGGNDHMAFFTNEAGSLLAVSQE